MLFNSAVPKGVSRKFFKQWSGPWRVTSVLSDLNYRIEFVGNRCGERRRKLRKVVHFNHLKKFHGDLNETDTDPQDIREDGLSNHRSDSENDNDTQDIMEESEHSSSIVEDRVQEGA